MDVIRDHQASGVNDCLHTCTHAQVRARLPYNSPIVPKWTVPERDVALILWATGIPTTCSVSVQAHNRGLCHFRSPRLSFSLHAKVWMAQYWSKVTTAVKSNTKRTGDNLVWSSFHVMLFFCKDIEIFEIPTETTVFSCPSVFALYMASALCTHLQYSTVQSKLVQARKNCFSWNFEVFNILANAQNTKARPY